jgi:hypothetical protein
VEDVGEMIAEAGAHETKCKCFIAEFSLTLPHCFLTHSHCLQMLIIDGAAGDDTKIRHDVTFPLLTLHRGKDCEHFSTGFFQKEDIVYTGISYKTEDSKHCLLVYC